MAWQASISPFTEPTDFSKAVFSSPFNSISMIRSTPSAPMTTAGSVR